MSLVVLRVRSQIPYVYGYTPLSYTSKCRLFPGNSTSINRQLADRSIQLLHSIDSDRKTIAHGTKYGHSLFVDFATTCIMSGYTYYRGPSYTYCSNAYLVVVRAHDGPKSQYLLCSHPTIGYDYYSMTGASHRNRRTYAYVVRNHIVSVTCAPSRR